jgi:hypothetical protein
MAILIPEEFSAGGEAHSMEQLGASSSTTEEV